MKVIFGEKPIDSAYPRIESTLFQQTVKPPHDDFTVSENYFTCCESGNLPYAPQRLRLLHE